MFKKIVLTVVATAAVLVPSASDARPIVGPLPDICKNVPGVQTAVDIEGGYWAFEYSTPAKRDCVPGYRQGGKGK